MAFLCHLLGIKPHFLLDLSHALDSICNHIWYGAIEERHRLDQFPNISNEIVKRVLHIVGEIFLSLAEIGHMFWFSTVEGIGFHSFYLGFLLIVTVGVVVLTVLVLLFNFHRC